MLKKLFLPSAQISYKHNTETLLHNLKPNVPVTLQWITTLQKHTLGLKIKERDLWGRITGVSDFIHRQNPIESTYGATHNKMFLYFIPSPQQVVWTHHTYIISYNMFWPIKPSSCIWLFYIHPYSSASIPTLASVYILEYWFFSDM
jgi:hypothetical protein